MARKNHNCKQKVVKKAEKKASAPKKDRRKFLKIESKLFATKYTNERIRRQIDNDSILFFVILGMFIFAIVIITMSFVRAYMDVSADWSFAHWLGSVRSDHPLGLVFGITTIIVAYIGADELGTLNMAKHIFPATSGRRYSAAEIDELANDPDTVWIDDARVYATPKALIGFTRGLAVAEYGDIAEVIVRSKHHSKNTSYTAGRRAITGPTMAAYYALTDHYHEWDTYYIIIKTKDRRRFVLTETGYKEGYKSLIPILDEKCGKVEYKIKGQC
ncbi:MAG: hypothetical protein J6X33_06280 [Clostridiales bacterium]|nr:hypothetical protein [Clostridiales bacterium]